MREGRPGTRGRQEGTRQQMGKRKGCGHARRGNDFSGI